MASMASVIHLLLFSLSCSFLFFLSESQTLSQPEAITISKPNLLVLPVQKDASTGLHWANMYKRTPLLQVPVLLDLNGKFLWVKCEKQNYVSSTLKSPFCHSTQCSRANTHYCRACSAASSDYGPSGWCHNNTCGLVSVNPVTQQTGMGELAQDVLAIQATTTRGSKLGPMMRVPQFLFACAPSFLVQRGLPSNVQGAAGLGHAPIALPNQLVSHFGLQRKFTMCLSGSPKSKGVVFFGDGPSNLLPGIDISHDLIYTPLIISPQGEYYMQVTSISVNKQTVPLNSSCLSAFKNGQGGTMLSTAAPYTVLHHSIFTALTQVFASQLAGQAQVKAVAPFGLCFDSKRFTANPTIELVLDKPNVVWRISGENLMVQAQPGVTCLSLVDGGLRPKAAIVIGAQQLQDNLVQFDSVRSRLGFSCSLLTRGTKCANFYSNNSP